MPRPLPLVVAATVFVLGGCSSSGMDDAMESRWQAMAGVEAMETCNALAKAHVGRGTVSAVVEEIVVVAVQDDRLPDDIHLAFVASEAEQFLRERCGSYMRPTYGG